ncbi:hypothetical protein DFH08DRAFT_1044366, partial [Mycena albidolilacea]
LTRRLSSTLLVSHRNSTLLVSLPRSLNSCLRCFRLRPRKPHRRSSNALLLASAPFMMLPLGPSSSTSLPRRHSVTPLTQHNLSSANRFGEEGPSIPSAHGPFPALNRRHSLNLMRKPLRSSPLAGPALSSDGFHEAERPKTPRVRVLSTPNLHSRTRSDPAPPVPISPPVSKRLSRRASLLEIVKRPFEQKRPPLPAPPFSAPPAGGFPSIVYTPLPPPPLSSHHERARSRSTSMSTTDSYTACSAPASFPRAYTAASSCQPTLPVMKPNADMPAVYGSGHYKNDSEDNWLTTTPYGITPRFSRLGLTAPSVVLPVSARASRRKSLRGGGGQRVSLAPVMPPRQSNLKTNTRPEPVTPPRSSSLTQTSPVSSSTPSLLTRRRSSRSFSSERPSTPSATSISGTDSVVFAEGDGCESDEISSPHDFDVLSDADDAQVVPAADHTPENPFAFAKPPSSWGLSMRRRHGPTHMKGVSFLSFGSGDSSTGFSPIQSPVQSYFPAVQVSAPPARPVQTAAYTPPVEASTPGPYLEVPGAPPLARSASASTCAASLGASPDLWAWLPPSATFGNLIEYSTKRDRDSEANASSPVNCYHERKYIASLVRQSNWRFKWVTLGTDAIVDKYLSCIQNSV